jgi:SAM-dependent methyltransferase
MSSVWDERGQAYRESPGRREGPDLDLLVEWCEPGSGIEALDVATGGGHVARRLQEAGCRVVTCDQSPGMRPDVVCRAEDIPFADGSFDVVASRIAAHHFADVQSAVGEMARVSRCLLVLEDTLFVSEEVEEAERLRDPSHVRSLSEEQWRAKLESAGVAVEQVAFVEKRHSVDEWLARTGCRGVEAERVRELLADRIHDGFYVDTKILLKARKP